MHELLKDGRIGIAMVREKNQTKFELCITKDHFKTIKIINNELINQLELTSIKLTDEGFIIISGLKDDVSEIWISKDEGKTFEMLLKMDGKISGLDYDGKNRFLYFGNILSDLVGIYRYSL